jgi:hypothetical protein
VPAINQSNATARLAHQEARLQRQFRQAADDAVGPDRGVPGQPDAVTVVPDRVNAEPLGCHDFPFKAGAGHVSQFHNITRAIKVAPTLIIE